MMLSSKVAKQVIARNGEAKQSHYVEYLQTMRLLHDLRNDVFFDFLQGHHIWLLLFCFHLIKTGETTNEIYPNITYIKRFFDHFVHAHPNHSRFRR